MNRGRLSGITMDIRQGMNIQQKKASRRQPKKKSGVASRQLALEVLLATQQQGQFVNSALADALKECQLSERDRAFATALVHGVIRNQAPLDSKIDVLSDRPAQKI